MTTSTDCTNTIKTVSINYKILFAFSHIKPKLHDITVCHDVVLSFHAHSAVSAGFGNAAVLDQVIVTHDLGLDKASLEVRVDDAGRLGRRRSGTAG